MGWSRSDSHFFILHCFWTLLNFENICVCTYTNTFTFSHACIPAYTFMYLGLNLCVCVCLFTDTYMYAHVMVLVCRSEEKNLFFLSTMWSLSLKLRPMACNILLDLISLLTWKESCFILENWWTDYTFCLYC